VHAASSDIGDDSAGVRDDRHGAAPTCSTGSAGGGSKAAPRREKGAVALENGEGAVEREGTMSPLRTMSDAGSSVSSGSKTAVKPRVPHAGVGANDTEIKVGDSVEVAVKTRWSMEYLGIEGVVERWWTPHNPKVDNRCVVSFPPPLGLRVINARLLRPYTPPAPKTDGHEGKRARSDLTVEVPLGEVQVGKGTEDWQVKFKAVDFVLNAVIRQDRMQAQEKLLAISRICRQKYGEYVCKCLAGNGCNPETKSLDGCPMWDRAVLQMCKLLSLQGLAAADAVEAEAVSEALQASRGRYRMGVDSSKNEVRHVYVAVQDVVDGACTAVGVEFSVPRAMLLHDGLRVAGLTSLDLSNQNITSKSLQRLLDPLLKGESLSLRRVCLAGNPIQDLGATHLLPLLDSSTPVGCRLECLDVSKCMIWARGCKMIANALCGNTHLVTLSLGGNDAGAPTCIAVSEMLLVNTTLLNLDLSNAGIPPGGMEQLARSLAGPVSLRKLNLAGNCSCDANVELWRRILHGNCSLSWLNLPCSARLPAEARESIVEELTGYEISLPLEMKVALCMGRHERLGGSSLLACVSEHALFDILRFTWMPRVVTLDLAQERDSRDAQEGA